MECKRRNGETLRESFQVYTRIYMYTYIYIYEYMYVCTSKYVQGLKTDNRHREIEKRNSVPI